VEPKSANSPARREELRAFLRSRRARILPHEVGVPAIGNRRLPGLTREDVAHLAGVSFKWYGRFESGLAVGVSRRFLDRVSIALKLNSAEKRHLYSLSGYADPPNDQPTDASGLLRPLIQQLGSTPAAVFSPLFDVLHCNHSYDHLFQHATQQPGIRSNALWRLFLDRSYRDLWYGWEDVARRATAQLRYMNRLQAESEPYRSLIAALSQSSDFARLWDAGEVCDPTERCPSLEIETPTLGKVAFDSITILQSDSPRLMFIALIPSDEAVRERFRLLEDPKEARGRLTVTPFKRASNGY
jgi:transcriptional regulator with XRE-family HTH domain